MSAHPPSPRRQRLQANAPTARDGAPAASPPRDSEPASLESAATGRRPAARGNYLVRHWRGDLPLLAAVAVSASLVWGGVQLLSFAARRLPLTDYPIAGSVLWLLEATLLLVGAVWWGMGVMRSAMSHGDRGGSLSIALLTGVVGLGAFFWAGAFWMQSARHVLPDVWATLTGTALPARVELDRAAGHLVVTGDFEFGTTRAVRAALATHRHVRTVRLESRGGRVAEGLALGRLLVDRGLDTLVTTECSSACVTAFAGGNQRFITAQTRLGLHSAGGKGVRAEHIDAANRETDQFIATRGVAWHVLERGSAVANDSIWFPEPYSLLASGLATEYYAARR